MKRLSILLALFVIAGRAHAQDVDFGAFGDDPGSLLAPGPPAAASPARGTPAAPPPPPDRLVRLRDILLKAEAPLTREQETALNTLLNAEIPAMRRTLQTHGREMMAARQASSPTPGIAGAPGAPTGPAPPSVATSPAPASSATPPPRGAAPAPTAPAATAPRGSPPGGAPNPALLAALAARGAPPSSRVPADILDALEVEMRQMNDALFVKVASSPALDAKQQTVLTQTARTQMKSRGGYEALRISMEDAGAPFTPEQIPQVQSLFEEQKRTRAELAKEYQGTPDAERLKQLDRETLTRVVGLLTPAQRTALLGLLRAQQ